MKSFFKRILTLFIIVIILICLGRNLGILDFFIEEPSVLQNIDETKNYYYKTLNKEEKIVYAKLDKAVNKKANNVKIGINNVLQDNINKAITAYFYDNPELFYLSNSYEVKSKELFGYKYTSIDLSYTDNNKQISLKEEKLNNELDSIINKVIKAGMTDYEKELAIHDELIKHINYYNFSKIENIPDIKHTAYGAIIENEAVCDGYSKAFKLLLEKVGIESIIISGKIGDIPHAWNLVNINGDYYHVDVTSDTINKDNKKYVSHTYFNLTDNEIIKTHVLDNKYSLPKCSSDIYNYYKKENLELKYSDNVYIKLKQIIQNNKSHETLEFKADSRFSSNRIMDELYDLNYNNWKTNRISTIAYSKAQDVYIIVK